MGDIREIHNPWRDGLLPAQYGGASFYVDSGSVESGRRIVEHEFPKRDAPYAEDMGRRAIRFQVRAYCVAYPRDAGGLKVRDYRKPRDALKEKLETGGSASLQLPTLKPLTVVCERYRLTEEEKYGGYCVFDISFAEAGSKDAGSVNSGAATIAAAQSMSVQIVSQITAGPLAVR